MGADAVDVRVRRRDERPPFPNYTELPVRVPIRAWQAARVASLAATLGLCIVLLAAPDTGLKLVWKVLVPILPIVWFAFPGLWRNVCPLATSNQIPRVVGFARGGKPPPLLVRRAYVVGIALFLLLVPMRKILFDHDGAATAGLVLSALVLAFVGGYLFKGKSGWCSTLCPLLPVQRLYGETPFLLVRNSHCEPCVGCAKNCFDFNPRVAKLADLHDDDSRYAAPRRFFAAVFPGLVLGFFSMPDVPADSAAWIVGRMALFVAVSVAMFTFAETFLPVSSHKLTATFAAVALNAFYWYNVPTLVDTVGGSPEGAARAIAIWTGRGIVLALTVPWLVRTFAKEELFRAANLEPTVVASRGLGVLRGSGGAEASVQFRPDGPEVAVSPGTPLLDVIETAGLPVEAGCRMGACGADPVAVLDGGDALSPMGSAEASTLGRLGLADTTRLACQARVHGDCVVSVVPERRSSSTRPMVTTPVDPQVRRLVILGSGVAGATAADHARRAHPDCRIDVVEGEPHRLYNRMAISRLIYGRSAMQGLYLLPDSWYEDNDVTCWLNTRARSMDRQARTVSLATGDVLEYDRLILATGSRSVVLDVPGVDLPGSFTLRSADDAITIRSFVQHHDVESALVAGGGLLGLEAAYALHKLGLRTTVLERDPWLLRRQLDETGARVLERYLAALGLTIATGASLKAVSGVDRVQGAVLADGRKLDAGLFLACPGIVPNAEVAREAGLAVERGVVVDERMCTSDPYVYAAGDVAEYQGAVVGLWPQSARQGEVAAINAVGGDATYVPAPPTTLLKVVGVDLASIGQFEPSSSADVVVALEDDDEGRYRKLVVRDGRVVGAILIGHSREVPVVQHAVERSLDVSSAIPALQAGEWDVLDDDRVESRV